MSIYKVPILYRSMKNLNVANKTNLWSIWTWVRSLWVSIASHLPSHLSSVLKLAITFVQIIWRKISLTLIFLTLYMNHWTKKTRENMNKFFFYLKETVLSEIFLTVLLSFYTTDTQEPLHARFQTVKYIIFSGKSISSSSDLWLMHVLMLWFFEVTGSSVVLPLIFTCPLKQAQGYSRRACLWDAESGWLRMTFEANLRLIGDSCSGIVATKRKTKQLNKTALRSREFPSNIWLPLYHLDGIQIKSWINNESPIQLMEVPV